MIFTFCVDHDDNDGNYNDNYNDDNDGEYNDNDGHQNDDDDADDNDDDDYDNCDDNDGYHNYEYGVTTTVMMMTMMMVLLLMMMTMMTTTIPIIPMLRKHQHGTSTLDTYSAGVGRRRQPPAEPLVCSLLAARCLQLRRLL